MAASISVILKIHMKEGGREQGWKAKQGLWRIVFFEMTKGFKDFSYVIVVGGIGERREELERMRAWNPMFYNILFANTMVAFDPLVFLI